jgi:hypothetical protein
MGKLKEIEIFSQEDGSIAKFFIYLGTFAALILGDGIITSLIADDPIHWVDGLLVVSILITVVTAVYFLTRFLAYRTKVFPKTENREGIHGVSFVFLLIVSFIITMIII